MSSAPGGDSNQNAAQGLQKLVDLASRELQKRVVAQNLLAESSGVREQARALRQSEGDAPAGPSQEELDRFSFLWNGPEPERTVHELPAQTREDLQLAGIVRAMAIHGSAERYLTALLGAQLSTVEQIGHRQSVLQAILAHPPLEEVVREATLRVILAGPLTTMDNRAALYRVVNHLSELELYVATTEALADALTAVGDAGPVWSELAALLDRIRETAAHRQLLSFLPGVLADVRGMASITIGVNLDAQLRPVEATLLSVNRERFKGSKLMSTVLGKAAAEGRGIADLHSLLRPGHAKPLVRGAARRPGAGPRPGGPATRRRPTRVHQAADRVHHPRERGADPVRLRRQARACTAGAPTSGVPAAGGRHRAARAVDRRLLQRRARPERRAGCGVERGRARRAGTGSPS